MTDGDYVFAYSVLFVVLLACFCIAYFACCAMKDRD